MEIDEGVTFNDTHLKELFEIYDLFFRHEPFGYLSNRVNDYSINLSPSLYQAIHPNLCAVAAVCYNEVSLENALFEKTFYKTKPFQAFIDYDEAVRWLQQQLRAAKK